MNAPIQTPEVLWSAQDPAARTILDLVRGVTAQSGGNPSTELADLAYRHGLIPQFSRMFPDVGRPIAHRLSARQHVMTDTLRRILTAFAAAGVDIAVLKGPYLSELVYDTPTDRTFSDIDLLVRRDSLDRALEILRLDEGFVGLPAKRPTSDKREVTFAGPAGVSFNVDLHWDLFSYAQLRGSAQAATAELWNASQQTTSPHGQLTELPMWGYFVFLCTHATLDHRFRLILFRDLFECLSRGFDLNAAVDFAKRNQLASPLYVGLSITRGLFGDIVPDDVLRQLRPSYAAMRYLERVLPKTDLVRFDGHAVHPVNLAFVLLHDSPKRRMQLLASAPAAFPGWRRRVIERRHDHA